MGAPSNVQFLAHVQVGGGEDAPALLQNRVDLIMPEIKKKQTTRNTFNLNVNIYF